MDIGTISLVLMLGLILLLAIGMPLGLASAVLAVGVLVMKFEPALLTAPWPFGDGILTGRPGAGPLNILAQRIYGLLTDYVLISIPLFIFMAALLERSGIAKEMYSSLNVWLNRTRGGIAIVTSIMAVIMAAMSGIIGGEVVLLGLIALPQMLRLGYNQNLAIGVICASGSLGTMIPPSIILIFYGLTAEVSISHLFLATLVPGLMLASFYVTFILVRCGLNPALGPPLPPQERDMPLSEKLALFKGVDVIPKAGAGFADPAEQSVGQGEILLIGEFHIHRLVGDQGHVNAEGFQQGGIIRGAPLGRFTVSLEDRFKPEPLGCLRAPEAIAGDGFIDPAAGPGPLKGIRHGEGGNGTLCLVEAFHHPPDGLGRDEGSRTIMDEDVGGGVRH